MLLLRNTNSKKQTMKTQITLRVNLLSYFLLIVSLVAVTIISIQYYFSLQLAHQAAEDNFQQISEKMSVFTKEKGQRHFNGLRMIALQKNIFPGNIMDPQSVAKSMLVGIIRNSPDLYSTYIGLNNGDFFQIINLDLDTAIREKHSAPENSKWLLVRITEKDNQRTKTLDFLDNNLKSFLSQSVTTDYDPRLRPWHMMAMNSSDVVATELYWFSGIKSAGITFALQLEDASGVVGFDIPMHSINEFLAKQDSSHINETFLFDRYGYKYASSSAVSPYSSEPIKPSVSDPIKWTPQEQAYLDSKPVLNVSNETDWPPMDFSVSGTPEGYSIDIIKLIAAKTGIKMKFINGFTWNELVKLFKERKLDLLQPLYWTKEREKMGIFTQPFAALKSHLITRAGSGIKNMEQLRGKTIALPKGWSTVNFIKNNHPEINIATYPTLIECLLAVEHGHATATIDNAQSLSFNSRKFNLTDLELGIWVEAFDNGEAKGLHMMVQPDNPLLAGILNKALASLSNNEQQQLENKWLHGIKSISDDFTISPDLLVSTVNDQNELVIYEDNGVKYVAYAQPVEHFLKEGHYIGITAPLDKLTAPYMKQVWYSIYAAVFVLALAFILVLYATSRILRPINELMGENTKISERRYHDVKKVHSNIKEFISLSQSLIDMSNSIQAYEKSQEELMESFILLIADAIDAKSPYTGGHCNRVPEIAMKLARVASDSNEGEFADFAFTTEEQWREFRIGAWLHDCGKVVTPEFVVDKATKLETVYNRIHEVRMRFEVLWRDVEIAALNRQLQGEELTAVKQWMETQQQQLSEEFAFVAETNVGGEFLSDGKLERLEKIAQRNWQRHFDNRLGLSHEEEKLYPKTSGGELPVAEKLLDDKPEHIVPRENFDHQAYIDQGFKLEVPKHLYNRGELYNLGIKRGTLTDEDRFKINEHVIMTIRMLEQLPLPKALSRVPEYAGTHHETMIGTGYPRKLCREELSVPARIMALADIFEALTASDRPYKKGKKLSEALNIMVFMCKDQHIDTELFKLFLTSGTFLDYSHECLKPEQIDDIDINDYLQKL